MQWFGETNRIHHTEMIVSTERQDSLENGASHPYSSHAQRACNASRCRWSSIAAAEGLLILYRGRGVVWHSTPNAIVM